MKRLVEIVAVALAVAAIGAGDAQAQGYAVEFDCGRSDGWSAGSTNENFASYRDCAGGWLAGMKTYAAPHNDARTSTGFGAHTFRGPSGTAITGVDWEGNKYLGVSSLGWIGGGWSFKTAMLGDNFRDVDPNAHCHTDNYGSCFAGDPGHPNAISAKSQVRGLWESSLSFLTQCVPSPNPCPTNSDGMSGHSFTRAGLVLNRGRVYLADLTDPSITSVGGSLVGGGWKRGVVDVTVTADDNSGVCQIASFVDDTRQEIPLARDQYALKQCAPGGVNGYPISWNTVDWADGPHRAAVMAWDAAGRATGWGWHTFYTDNNAPAAPSNLSIDGGEDWSPSNSRTIRWTNPSQGPGSGIAGARVQVCRTGTSDCRVSDHGGGGVVSGVGGFAGPGDYTVRVALRDAAGNFDPGALSNGVRLRFDDVAPGEAQARQSNGWLNAEERAAYQQHVKLKDGTPVPVSGIRGYSITADGVEPDAIVEAPGAEAAILLNGLPEGINTVKARAVSNAGVGSGFVDSATVQVDLSKPAAWADGAPDSAKWHPKAVSVTLRGADQPNLSGMAAAPTERAVEEGAYIAYKIDGGALQRVRGAEAPITVGEEGEHTVAYYAVDFAGNQSDTETVQFKIDRTNPTASATTDAADGEVWQRESVTVTLTGDDGAGRSGMDAATDGEPVDAGAHLAYRLDAGPVQKMRGGAATFKVEADGDHVVEYYAVDGAGNASERREVRFRIDRTAPGLVLFEPQGSDKRRIELTVDDATSGVGEVAIGIRRVGDLDEAAALKRLARTDPKRYRATRLRGTRRHRGAKRGRAGRIAAFGDGWTYLQAAREGNRYVALIPNDRTLQRGVYQLQAVAQDRAGNEKTGDRFRGGGAALLPIDPTRQPGCCTSGSGSGAGGGAADDAFGGGASPLGPDLGTVDTKVVAGAVAKVRIPVKLPRYCKKPRTTAQKKRCAKLRRPRYRQVFVNKLAVPFGKGAKLKGVLTTSAGSPVADGVLDVVTTPTAVGHLPRAVGAVRTDRSGAFTYTAPAGSSRKVTFRFRGLGDLRRSEGDVTLRVPGAATLKPNRRQVANGESVTFSGKLLGKPLPPRGKLVDLQVLYRGKWRTFAAPRANGRGAFRFRYRFEATRITTTYRFRARIRAEAAYPYELGYSKVVSVRVRGR
jgi:hypothetical protein